MQPHLIRLCYLYNYRHRNFSMVADAAQLQYSSTKLPLIFKKNSLYLVSSIIADIMVELLLPQDFVLVR